MTPTLGEKEGTMPGMNLQRLVGLLSLPVGLSECEAERWMDRLLKLIRLDREVRILEGFPDAR